ncbi:Uncharacterised protein [Vibrio cholerae]|nr:Uncharacterised protein [Vibrio cholerae]
MFTSLNTGTTRPFGVSTAIPMFTYFFRIKLSPSSDREELNAGKASSAFAAAFMMNTSGVIFIPVSRFASIAFCS